MGVRLMNLGEGDTVVADSQQRRARGRRRRGSRTAPKQPPRRAGTTRSRRRDGRRDGRRVRHRPPARRRTVSPPKAPPAEAAAAAAADASTTGRTRRAGHGASRRSPCGARCVTVRRARVAVTRVDPWSVMKLSFVLSLALVVVFIVAAGDAVVGAERSGVFDQLNTTLAPVTGHDDLRLQDIVVLGRVDGRRRPHRAHRRRAAHRAGDARRRSSSTSPPAWSAAWTSSSPSRTDAAAGTVWAAPAALR